MTTRHNRTGLNRLARGIFHLLRRSWLENNKCEKHPTEISRGANYTKEVYSSCEGGSNVVFYAINDGKHEWPGWRLNPIKNIMGKGLKANDLIWDFFSSI